MGRTGCDPTERPPASLLVLGPGTRRFYRRRVQGSALQRACESWRSMSDKCL